MFQAFLCGSSPSLIVFVATKTHFCKAGANLSPILDVIRGLRQYPWLFCPRRLARALDSYHPCASVATRAQTRCMELQNSLDTPAADDIQQHEGVAGWSSCAVLPL